MQKTILNNEKQAIMIIPAAQDFQSCVIEPRIYDPLELRTDSSDISTFSEGLLWRTAIIIH